MFTTYAMTFEDKIDHMFDWEMDAPLYSSLIVMLIVLVLALIVGIKANKAVKNGTFKEKPKGLLFLGDWYYEFCHKFVVNNMGMPMEKFTGYFMGLFIYFFIAFVWGLTGLPTIIDWLAAPLSLSLIMFVFIHGVAIRYQKIHYFKRYVQPFAVFLPINLITMWSPIISTSIRMFGNCLSGTIIIGIIQWVLGGISGKMFMGLTPAAFANYFPVWDIDQTTVWTQTFLAPLPMGFLNLYFDLFSGFVQTLVFCMLNAAWIAQERPIPEEEMMPTRNEGVAARNDKLFENKKGY